MSITGLLLGAVVGGMLGGFLGPIGIILAFPAGMLCQVIAKNAGLP